MALHEAARNGLIDKIEQLLLSGEDINDRDKLNRTPLHLASWAGKSDAVQYLCEKNAAVGSGASDDMTAVHFACQKGHIDVVRILLAAGAKITNPNRKGLYPLHFAVLSENEALIKLVARKAPQIIGSKNKAGATPLGCAKSENIKNLLKSVQKEAEDKVLSLRDKVKNRAKDEVKVPSAVVPIMAGESDYDFEEVENVEIEREKVVEAVVEDGTQRNGIVTRGSGADDVRIGPAEQQECASMEPASEEQEPTDGFCKGKKRGGIVMGSEEPIEKKQKH